MANVVKVTEVFRSEGTLNESAIKEFEVLFDTVDANALEACTANDGTTQIPSFGTWFSGTLAGYTSQRPIARRVGKSPLFRVTVPYAVNTATSGGNKAIHPLSRPTEWSSDGIPSTITTDRDATGQIIQNSAKQVLNLQIQHADKYIRAVKNYATMQHFDAYFNRTNSATYTIQGKDYDIETLWLSHVTEDFVEEEYDGEVIQYWRATFHFYAKIKRSADEPDKSWRFKILDRGTVTNTTGVGQGEAITDTATNIIVAETKLNGQGAVWDGTTPWFLDGTGFSTAAPTNNYTTIYQTADFNNLGL